MLIRTICVLALCASFARAQSALEDAVEGYLALAEANPPTSPWNIEGGLGLTITDGNSNTTALAATLDAKREWEKWKSSTVVRIAYARSEGVETASEWILVQHFERTLDEKSALYIDIWLEHDEFESLNWRLQPTVGYKRRFRKTETFELWGNVGAGFVHDEYRFDPNTEGLAQLGFNFEWKITKSLTYTQVFQIYPSLSDGGEFRFVFDAKFSTPIADKIDANLIFTDKYNSNPTPGIEKNDILVLFTLSVKFTKAS